MGEGVEFAAAMSLCDSSELCLLGKGSSVAS